MIRLKVKEIAKRKGLSQGKLSRKSDVNLTTIQLIWRKPTTANITLYTLDRLATALEVDASELIESVRESDNNPTG